MMKYSRALFLGAVLLPITAFAAPQSIQTLDGVTYENFTVSTIGTSQIKIMDAKGVHNLKIGQIKDEDLEALGVDLVADPIVKENLEKQRESLRWSIRLASVREQKERLALPTGGIIETKNITSLNPLRFTYKDATGAKSIELADLPSETRKLFGYNKEEADAYLKKIEEQDKLQRMAATASLSPSSGGSAAQQAKAKSFPADMTKDQIIAERKTVRAKLREKGITPEQRTQLETMKLQLDDMLRKANATQ